MEKFITTKTKIPTTDILEFNHAIAYCWVCHGLENFIPLNNHGCKFGFCAHTYGTINSPRFTLGLPSRIKQTLIEMENALNISNVLTAEILGAKEGTFNKTLSAEQFIHFNHCKEQLFPKKQGLISFGGQSEFYDVSIPKARAIFANSWRTSNLAKGRKILRAKRRVSLRGVPRCTHSWDKKHNIPILKGGYAY